MLKLGGKLGKLLPIANAVTTFWDGTSDLGGVDNDSS